MVNRKVPVRTCVGCRTARPKRELIRVVKTPQGEIKLDLSGKLSGRGAYICKCAECLERARRSNALSRSLEISVAPEIYEGLKSELKTIEE